MDEASMARRQKARRAMVWTAVAALAAVIALPYEAAAMRPAASAAAVCTKDTKRLKTFKRGMKAAQRRFFRTHSAKKVRARFVKQQNAKLKRLQRARKRCLANQPPGQPQPQPQPQPDPPSGGGGGGGMLGNLFDG